MLQVAILINDPHKSILSRIVNLFTRSTASHVEIVFSDGMATIVTPSERVLAKRDEPYDLYHWVMIPLPEITYLQESLIRKKAEEIFASHPKYDYLGAISGFFGSSRQDKSRWYCGELVVELLRDYVPELAALNWAIPEDIWFMLADKK
jgi:hypothetical protein